MAGKIVRRVAIYEIGRCEKWRVEGLGGYRCEFEAEAAVHALEHVKEADAKTARDTGENVATFVDWHWKTGIGRVVVNAITGGRQ